MYEVEVKARVINPSSVSEYLKQRGFSERKFEVKDYYFNHPCRDFAKSDEELRLRIEKDGSHTRILLTYKGPSLRGDRSIREEIEIPINSMDLVKILKKLGFLVDLVKEKRGIVFQKGKLKVYLCRVSGFYRGKHIDLGYFVEVEMLAKTNSELKEARKEVINFLANLPGIGNIEQRYYTEMIKEI